MRKPYTTNDKAEALLTKVSAVSRALEGTTMSRQYLDPLHSTAHLQCSKRHQHTDFVACITHVTASRITAAITLRHYP
jgi:primosomal protein N''